MTKIVDTDYVILAVLIMLVSLLVLVIIAAGDMVNSEQDKIKAMQAEAVSIGAAEWAIDNKTGHTTFKWKYPQQGE